MRASEEEQVSVFSAAVRLGLIVLLTLVSWLAVLFYFATFFISIEAGLLLTVALIAFFLFLFYNGPRGRHGQRRR